MTDIGRPSREQMEYYYDHNRSYFESMAEHYKEADPDYYDKVIAPVKREAPYRAGYDDNKAKKGLFVIAAVMVLLVGLAAAMISFFMMDVDEKNPVDEILEQNENNDGTNRQIKSPIESTLEKREVPGGDNSVREMSTYEKGIFYYDMGEKDKALNYFKQVPEGDDNYNDAQEKITEISDNQNNGRDGGPAPK